MKLTSAQIAVLEAAVDRDAVDYYRTASAGGSGRTLSTLMSRGLLTERRLANKQRAWVITDAGRAALAEIKP